MARRNVCNKAHAVSYEPKPTASFRLWADMPSFCDVTNRTAANQVDNGLCERWKVVPDGAEVVQPHSGHEKPSGHRNCPRGFLQATSSGNHVRNS
jgi:hypothetical protein